MAYPILYKPKVCAGIEEVRGNRVLEHMEMSLALRNPGLLCRSGTQTGAWSKDLVLSLSKEIQSFKR
jgi:hypothetical protein